MLAACSQKLGKMPGREEITLYLHLSTLSVGHRPTFPELKRFLLKDEFINIAELIGKDYSDFGIFILNDKTGSKVTAIAKTEHGNSVAVTVEILRLWLQGKGRMPVTWQTLIKCLQDAGLNTLANDIESAMSQEDGSQAADNAGPSVHKAADNAGPSVQKAADNAGPSVQKAADNAGPSEQPPECKCP